MFSYDQFLPAVNSIDPRGFLVDAALVPAFGFTLYRDFRAIKNNEPQFGIDLGINKPAIEHLIETGGQTEEDQTLAVNEDVVNRALVSTEDNKPVKDRYFRARERLYNHAAIGLGVVGLLTCVAIQPGNHTIADVPSAVVGVTLDSSLSNTYTTDIGTTLGHNISRFSAAVEALDASGFAQEISVDEEGAGDPVNVVSLGPVDKASLKKIKPLPFSAQNGDCLVAGMSDSVEAGDTDKLIVVSDGDNTATSCSSTTPTLAQEAAILKKEKVSVDVIVPGTTGTKANYSVSGSSIFPSAANAALFTTVFGNKNVTTINNEAAFKKVLQNDEDTTKFTNKRSESDIPNFFWELPPAALAAAGLLLERRRLHKSLVSNLSH